MVKKTLQNEHPPGILAAGTEMETSAKTKRII